jgi:hypothetical protein
MNTAEFLGAVISLGVFMLGTTLGVIYFVSHQLGQRLDRIESRLYRIEDRLTSLEVAVAPYRTAPR